MKQRPRIHYTEALMWERWQKGESLQQIAQLFDRNHSSVQPILAATGGIRPARLSRLARRQRRSRRAPACSAGRRIATGRDASRLIVVRLVHP